MKKKQFIASLSAGDTVECYFVVVKAERKLSKANTPYWDLLLQDATGSLPAKIWFPYSSDIIEIPKESFVFIKALVEVYNHTSQFKIEEIEIIDESRLSSFTLADFVRSSQYTFESMWNDLQKLCKDVFTHSPWYKFTSSFFATPSVMKSLQTAVAAKNMHHAYKGGLLEHMLSVAYLCRLLASHYPQIDEQLLVAGALFHDIGKLVELEGFLTTEYTTEGKLLGHITQGIELITHYMEEANLEYELSLQLKHLILSHHGHLEFGSPKLPQTAEAFLLHYADNIDAKMEVFRTVFETIPQHEEAWTRVYGMGDLFHPLSTQFFEKKNTSDDQETTSQQLSLLS